MSKKVTRQPDTNEFFPQDGAIGSQFDASKGGLAGKVEKAVDGPRRPASDPKNVNVNTGTSSGSQR